MGLTNMFTASTFDGDVEKATSENNTSDDWALILDICDKVGNSPQKAKECLRSIIKRLNSQVPFVVLQATTLLDACICNCGNAFKLEVSSREFDAEMKKVIKKWPPSSGVGPKLRTLVKKWSEAEFKSDPQLSLLTSMWSRMKEEGLDLTIHADPTAGSTKSARPTDPDSVSSQQEVDDIAKAIELSLKESPKSGPLSSSGGASGPSSLYPTLGGLSSATSSTTPAEPRKVRALYDFEAAEENELTFFAGEIIHVLDDSDANWWKGCNQRGEGLFPNNFVTPDLNASVAKIKTEKKGVQLNETVEVKTVARVIATEIDEEKIERVLQLLHEADPNVDTNDPPELLQLEEEVTEMGPLIDAELEKVDRKHAQLTQISGSLVEAMNMYHSLLREPPSGMMVKGQQQMLPMMYQTMPHLPPHHHMAMPGGPPPPPGGAPLHHHIQQLPGLPGPGGPPPQGLGGRPPHPGVFSPPGGAPPPGHLHHPGAPPHPGHMHQPGGVPSHQLPPQHPGAPPHQPVGPPQSLPHLHPGPGGPPRDFPHYQTLPPQHSQHVVYQNGPPPHFYPPPPN